jgi:hypothetical protein
VLPEGYISPKAARAVRDSLRTRAHLGRQQSAPVRTLPNLLVRQTGVRLSAKRLHALPLEEGERLRPEPAPVLAVPSSRAVGHCLGQPSTTVAKLVHTRLQHTPAYAPLQTVEGMGTMLAQTMVWETGARRRLPTVGP